MDRSFLTDKDVVAASRKFVCIRLATYEDAAENEVLKGIFAMRGTLQNTVFGILTPDGKTHIVRSGRSPAWAFGGQAGPGIHEQHRRGSLASEPSWHFRRCLAHRRWAHSWIWSFS